MAWIDDLDLLNNAANAGNWSASGFDTPTLNDSAATTPIYVEGSACMWWPLKKGTTNGYTYTSTISGTPTLTGSRRICVGFINYPFADIDAIPISSLQMRLSSSTGFTTNYLQWNARAQILSPENVPISGHTPIIGFEDAATETGTFNGNAESIGWVATSGNNADGKQGGFDYFFLISWVGAHSATLSGTYFSGLYSEYFDNEGQGLPGETNRPIAVLSQAGDFFQTNVTFQMGDGTSDTANIVVTETGKTIFFNNLHVNHELGYLFVNPASTHEIRLTLTDCVHLWNDQASTSEIFDGIANVDYFKIDGCSFSRGGKISLPADTANRWVRGCKFDDCQAGTISDGEFTDNIVSNGEAFTVSGDADLTGTQFLTPAVAIDTSGLVWNGNFDPDGNLDGCVFSKGTNAHHAIEFGTASPLTMTLRNIDFSGFNATTGQNDSTLHVKRTSGTVTINLVGCTGAIGYKSAGATVDLVTNPVTTSVNVKNSSGTNLQNARVFIETAATITGGEIYQAAVTSITQTAGTATVTTTAAHGLTTNDKVVIRKAQPDEYNKVTTATVTGTTTFTYPVDSGLSSPATGTPVVSYVIIHGLTDVNGDISASKSWGAAQQMKGWARLKNTSSPFYKQADIAFTVDTSNGNTINAVLQSDE